MECCNFSMMDLSKLNWHDIDYFHDIPEKVLFWIRDDQSLTFKLKRKYTDFRVQLIRQEEEDLFDHELDELGKKDKFIVREVFLYGNNEPVVFARSIIPNNEEMRPIIEIGEQPLGEVLFTHPAITREPIEVTFFNKIWGRRSFFSINGNRILVCEFFLDKFEF